MRDLLLGFQQHLAGLAVVFHAGRVASANFVLDQGHKDFERSRHFSGRWFR